jgi:hypothetical protein
MLDKSGKTVLFISPMMKAREVREACKRFREQYASLHGKVSVTKETPETAGEQIGCFAVKHLA